MSIDLEDLLLHQKTRKAINNFLLKPSHGLQIIGEYGSGKGTLAKALTAKLLDIAPSALESYPYFTHLYRGDAEREISVDTVRELIKNLGLKTVGSNQIRRVVFIENANYMSHEAQTSILKILEEPTPDTIFILSAPSERSILPTISSRVQSVWVNPISLDDARTYFSVNSSDDNVRQAWQLSGGGVGLLSALLSDTEPHALKEAVMRVKSLLNKTPYERLLVLDSLTKDKIQLLTLIDALNRVVTSLHHNAVRTNNRSMQTRLLKCRHLISEVQINLASNANHRLAMMHLAVNLSV